MRPINSDSSSSTTTTNEIKISKSPFPYLFLSLALMIILVSMALVLLVCSFRKRGSSQSSNLDEEMKHVIVEINSEPEILVIMAGEDKPTFLAKPIINSSSLPNCTCGAQSSSTISSSSLTNDQTLNH
ncbi:protein GLUTAMINE DUMPER 6-like [Trifolium pratense]|uniref:protein GLUTAMINE DUMPER 6-like n=1 Tax=Trifolium pratense TaxID=57577 RepID=UPI001E695C41|nr:protein GLUTAMINE DUMPER 6-like [Trifolium pratense]